MKQTRRVLHARNPRNGEVDYHVEMPNTQDLAERCDQLRRFQPAWQSDGIEMRVAALQHWKSALGAQRNALIAALTLDTGRRAESELEFQLLLSSIDRWCNQAPEMLQVPQPRPASIPFIQIQQHAMAYPVTGVISPWNFPLLLAIIDTLPALLAGSSVIIKPSEITPRFIQALAQSIAATPRLADVCACLPGDGETGADLVGFVDLVCFTGSVATGQKVANACAQRLIPAFLELGGKDPVIITKSADLDLASAAVLWGSTVNAGQSCLSIERVYVDEAVAEPFLQKLTQRATQVELAYPKFESGAIGPIIAKNQAQIIAEHLKDAIDKGALCLAGGDIQNLDGGLYLRPTVLSQCNHHMKIMRDETFGPVMPVMTFSAPEQAIQLANDSIYGLSAAVFAGTPAEAQAIATHLEAGAISINDCGLTAMVHDAEKNAFKKSGLGGSRMGLASLKRFLRQKAMLTNPTQKPDPWWFETQVSPSSPK